MIAGEGVLGLALFGLWVFCVIDVVTAPEDEVRNLPKLVWLLVVLLLSVVGSIAWLVAGRRLGSSSREYRTATSDRGFPQNSRSRYDRPGRARPTSPDDDDEFLARVRARAESQRRDAEIRRRAEQAEEENRQRGLRGDGHTDGTTA